MSNIFSTIDFDRVYPEPTSDRLAKAYFNRIWRKLHIENFSFLITYYGLHRVGKSLTAVSFAYIIDETFEDNLESRVVYNSRDLMRAFNEIRKKKIKGAGIIIDEAGTGDLSNQRWYEEMAKLVSANLQAVGYLNPFIGFVTQNFSFINATARRLSNGVFEISRSNNKYSKIKPFWIENNPWTSGWYKKYPIFCEKRNNIPSNVYKIKRIKISLPPKDILERYEEHSQAYKDKFLNDSEEEIILIEQEKEQKKAFVTGIDAIVEEVYRNRDNYMKYPQNRPEGMLDENLIRHEHELSYRDAKLVRTLAEKRIKNKKHTHTGKA